MPPRTAAGSARPRRRPRHPAPGRRRDSGSSGSPLPLIVGVIVIAVLLVVFIGMTRRRRAAARRGATSDQAAGRAPPPAGLRPDRGLTRWAAATSSGRSSRRILTIFMIVILNFVLFRMMPGSPDRILLRNPNVTTEAMAAARARWGLDKPLIPDQLVDYLEATAAGDLGYSFKFHGQPVTEVLAGRLWPTVILFGLGRGRSRSSSGWRSAPTRAGNAAARSTTSATGISLILYSMPYFVIGMP